jgi:hypothetical protein
MTKILEIVAEALEDFPRMTGVVIGLSLHPFLLRLIQC